MRSDVLKSGAPTDSRSGQPPDGIRRPIGLLDLVGVGLLLASATWALVTGEIRHGHPAPMVTLFLGCALAFVAGRLVSAWRPLVVPAAVAVVAAAMALASPLGTLSSNPLAGPLGYANAKAALYFQAAVAALTLAVLARNRPVRIVSVGAAALFALVPWITGSVAVALATLLLPIGWLASRGARPQRWAFIAVVPFLLVLGATTLLGADPPSEDSRMGQVLDATLERERLVLWHEAIAMVEAEPVLGVGPGRFDELSPSARRDADLWWAHHGFLQQGAETGVPGAALLVATFVWGYVRLGWARGAARAAPILAIGVLALGLQACVDYVLHFPAVALAASALVGVPPIQEGSS